MDLIHFRPSTNTRNVRCFNGSAHVQVASDIANVTCPLCKDPNTNKAHWNEIRFRPTKTI